MDADSEIMTVDTTSFNYDSYFKLDSYLSKYNIENGKFEIIDFDCAILIYPTVEQIDEMKKEEGEEDFLYWCRRQQLVSSTSYRHD